MHKEQKKSKSLQNLILVIICAKIYIYICIYVDDGQLLEWEFNDHQYWTLWGTLGGSCKKKLLDTKNSV